MVTIYAKPFVYTREIEHEEDEDKCLAESGILCTHHDSKSGMVYQLCHNIPLNLKLHNNEAQSSRKKEVEYLMIFFLFLMETICCDPSSEPSRRDGSDEGLQHMFSCRINNKKKIS